MRSLSFENWRENTIAEIEDIFPRYRLIANDLDTLQDLLDAIIAITNYDMDYFLTN